MPITAHQRRPIAAACAIAAVLCLLGGLAACDGADAKPTASPTPSAAQSSRPRNGAPEAHLQAAQQAYANYYKAYIDAARGGSTGKPPKSLLALTDPKGSVRDWLRQDFAAAKKNKSRVVGGEVKVTAGPEVAQDMWRSEVITFKACHDLRKLKFEESGKPVDRPDWQLEKVEMHAPVGSEFEMRKKPASWKVHAFNELSVGERCEFDA